MRWPEAGVRLFPSPHRAEPENLRQNIIDELADHLALAAEDEVVKHGRSQEGAWKRAVERFGNPDAVARKLWWDAMRERVMRDWIQPGVAVVSAVVVVLVGVLVMRTQTQIVETLQRMNQPAAPVGETLDIEVRRGTESGPPAAGVKVTLVARWTEDATGYAVQNTDAEGHVRFGQIPRGSYEIRLDDPQSGMNASMQHSLFAGMGTTRTVIAPDYAMSPVRCVLDPPLPFPNDRVLARAELVLRDPINDVRWECQRFLLVGNEFCYEPRRSISSVGTAEEQFECGDPMPTILLPPRPVRLADRSFYYLYFRDAGGVMTPIIAEAGATNNEGPERKGDTLTFRLNFNQIAGAAAYVKDYTFASRWLGVDTKRTATHGQSEHDKYLIAAIPITDALTASVVDAGGGKVTLTVQPNQTANPSSEPGPDELVGSSTNAAVFRLPSLDSVGENAASYDYVFSFCCSSADVSVWTGEQWDKELGSVFDIRVGETVPSMKDGRYDATEFVRQYLSRPTAERLNAGLLAQNISKEWLEGIVLSSGAQDKSQLPYVLVESDAPPADL